MTIQWLDRPLSPTCITLTNSPLCTCDSRPHWVHSVPEKKQTTKKKKKSVRGLLRRRKKAGGGWTQLWRSEGRPRWCEKKAVSQSIYNTEQTERVEIQHYRWYNKLAGKAFMLAMIGVTVAQVHWWCGHSRGAEKKKTNKKKKNNNKDISPF